MKAPPGERSRAPHQKPDPDTTTNSVDIVTLTADEWTRHGSPFCRWRHFDMNRRRREHAELKRRLENTRSRTTPSTFGLDDDELRRHANTLVLEHGWSVAEVVQVLDVEPAGAR